MVRETSRAGRAVLGSAPRRARRRRAYWNDTVTRDHPDSVVGFGAVRPDAEIAERLKWCTDARAYFGLLVKKVAVSRIWSRRPRLDGSLRVHPGDRQARRITAFPAIRLGANASTRDTRAPPQAKRSEEHTSELQSLRHLVCRLLLEKKNQQI